MQNEDIESLKTLVDTLESIHTELNSHKEISFTYDGIPKSGYDKYVTGIDPFTMNNLSSTLATYIYDKPRF